MIQGVEMINAIGRGWQSRKNSRFPVNGPTLNSQIMYYLIQVASINTHLPFKSHILKLVLADDFMFTDGFLPFLAFLISSLLVFKTFLKKDLKLY